MSHFCRVVLFLTFFSPCWCQVITTIAGTDWLFPGDGSKAVNAPIGGSVGLDVAIGPDGSFYIADADNQMVMRVGTDGILHVIAGNGFEGHWGDGGLAVNAALFNVGGVAVDSSGNVYLAEYGGRSYGGTIRRVTPTGEINTIAGTGAIGFAGDGGPATLAILNRPNSVAVDLSGAVYFVDQSNNRIRKFTPGGSILTIAGGGSITGRQADGGRATDAALGDLSRLAVDSGGNVYFLDSISTVRMVTPGGILSTVAGGGQSTAEGVSATQALLVPIGLAVDAAGSIYIADYRNSSIRKVTNGVIVTIAGGRHGFSGDGGPALEAAFNFVVAAVAVNASGVFVADNENLRVREVSGGIVQTVAGNGLFRLAGNGGSASSATIYYDSGIRSDAAGNIYFTEPTVNRVRKISATGTISVFAGEGPFGYTGDNGPASKARLGFPSYLATDPAGAVYVSDSSNNAIRKIDTNQIITTIAGTGVSGYTGDSGPAKQAKLDQPEGLDFDAKGDLVFADSLNHAIRVIYPNGNIFTVAGTGTAGFSGDGGLAAAAQLNTPRGVRFFAPGTAQEALYFSDTGNNRVRRIRYIGGQYVIDTVAGNGTPGYSGDGGPAIHAEINDPEGLAFGPQGVLYIADRANSVVRAVTPEGTIGTVVGNGFYNFSGDGGPAKQASLEGPFDLTFDANDNLLITDLYTNRIRQVLTTRPVVQANPTTLEFTAPAGSSGVQQTISVTGSIPNFVFGALVTPSNATWLSVSPITANAPAGVQATADPSKLTPGQYHATVEILAPYENPAILPIQVSLTVTQPGAPSVAVAPNALQFHFVAGKSAQSQSLSISNTGGGSLELKLKISTTGGNWLSAAADNVNVGAYGATRVQIQANPAGLGPGAYSGSITISSTSPPQSVLVPVTMIVSAVPQTILIPQNGLTFLAVQGGGLPPPQTFNILNAGQGQMSWNTSVSTVSGGNWLAAFPNNGVSDAASPSVPPQIRVNVFPGTLGPGIYYGSVKVTSPAASNSPQFVSVVLNLLPPGSHIGPLVQPTGMIFVAAAGKESPGSQTVLVQSLNTSPLTFTTGTSTSAGGNWLKVLPPGGTVTASEPVAILLQPIVDGLAPGVYQATLTLSFSDGNTRTVTIVFVVTAPAPGAESSQAVAAATEAASASCPSLLKVVFTELSTGSGVSVGFPGQVAVKVVDDCGVPMIAGDVTASFSNGDPPIALTSLKDGNWVATWTPEFPAAQALVTATAVDARQLTGTAQVTVGFQQFAQPPVVGTGAIVNGASFVRQAPLAPGTMISVFGSKLASTAAATTLPLPLDLGGSSLTVAGRPAPLLYSSDGQVNAIIPYGIEVNTGQQMLIARGSSLSVARGLTIAAASPGIFSTDGSGKGQGQIYVAHADAQTLADAAHPAQAGDIIVIYCTGLGEVSPAVAAGTPAPSDHLTSTVNRVSVTIGGVPAQVQFAGLPAGFAGLYQVNAKVPKGITPGAEVVLSMAAAGQVSAPTTMAVK